MTTKKKQKKINDFSWVFSATLPKIQPSFYAFKIVRNRRVAHRHFVRVITRKNGHFTWILRIFGNHLRCRSLRNVVSSQILHRLSNLLLLPTVFIVLVVVDPAVIKLFPFPGLDSGKFDSDVVVVFVGGLVVGRIWFRIFLLDRNVTARNLAAVSCSLTLFAGRVDGSCIGYDPTCKNNKSLWDKPNDSPNKCNPANCCSQQTS